MRRVLWIVWILCLGLPGLASGEERVLTGQVTTEDEVVLARARVTLHPVESTALRLERELTGETIEPAAGALSDEDGRFRLRAPSTGLWLLRVESPGFMPRTTTLKPLTESQELGAIRLTPAETLTVRVRGANADPMGGVTVYAATDRSRRSSIFGRGWTIPARIGTTNENGQVEFPRGKGERLRLVAVAEDHAVTERRGVLGGAATLRMKSGARREIVVLDAGGRPAPGVLVSPADHPLPWTRTAENGTTGVTVPSSGQEITISDRGMRLWHGEVAPASDPESGPFEIRLLETRVMAGRVIDAKTREAVTGAVVWDETNPLISAVSDDSGQFALQGPANHRLEILSGAVGYLRPEPFEYPLNDDGRTGPTIALSPAASITGRVIDANGEGVPGATVSMEEKHSGGMIRMRAGMPRSVPDATTDEHGRFRIAGIDPDLNFEIGAEADGFAPSKQPVAQLQPHETLSGVVLTLDAGRAIRGVTVDEDGNAVGGVELTAVTSSNNRAFGGGMIRMGGAEPESSQATSGAGGRFAVLGLPSGKFDLNTKRSGYAPHTVSAVDLEGDEDVDVGEITLVPGETIEGLVLDSDGAPVEGAEVTVTEASPMAGLLAGMSFGDGGHADAVSDPNGWFAVHDLSSDKRYTVIANRPGFITGQADGIAPPRIEPLELRLEPSSRLAGRVLDPSGDPIAAARVNMTRMRSVEAGGMAMQVAFAEDTVTDHEGRFAFEEQEPGKVSLRASASGYQEANLADLTIPKGEDLEDVRIELEAGAILQGRVVTPDGRPAIGASIGKVAEEQGFGPRFGGDVPVDGDGYYRLEGLAPGDVSIEAKHPDYPRIAKDVDLREGINAVNLAFEGGQQVSGRVVDTSGNPVPAAAVQAIQTGQYWGNAETTTEAGGDFTLPGVQDGEYTLRVEAEGYAESFDQRVTVEGQPVVGLEVVLDPGARIEGTVSGLDPKDFGRVSVRSSSGFDFHGTVVDHEGRFRIENVAPGDHELIGTLTDSAQRATTNVKVDPGMTEVAAELVFDSGVTLSGRVHQAGTPIAGATLSASSTSEDRAGWSQTDADGRFAMDGLVPGTYDLTIREFRSGLAHSESVEISTSREIEIEIPSAAVRGTVVDATDRQPLAGVQLRLTAVGETPRGFMPLHAATTDSTGSFELPAIADGTWELSAEKQGYAAKHQTLQVQHDRGEDVKVSLDPTEGVSLEVRLPSGGAPDSVRLAVLSGDNAIVTGSYATGENGSIRVSTVPPGQWDVLMSAPGTATTRFRVQAPGPKVPVQLQPATRLKLEAPALFESEGHSTVTISGSDGRPFRAVSWGGQPQSSFQMRNGRLTLSSLPPGSWNVRLESRDGQTWTGSIATTAGNEATLVLGGD